MWLLETLKITQMFTFYFYGSSAHRASPAAPQWGLFPRPSVACPILFQTVAATTVPIAPNLGLAFPAQVL